MSVLPTHSVAIFVPAYSAKTIDRRSTAELSYNDTADRYYADATQLGLRSTERPPYLELTIDGTARFFSRSDKVNITVGRRHVEVQSYVVVDGPHRGQSLFIFAA